MIQGIDSQRVEAAIQESSLVQVCRLLNRTTLEGKSIPVAYVVPAGPVSEKSLRESLCQTLEASELPEHFVCVPNLPLNGDGSCDDEALAKVPVVDDKLLDKIENAAQSRCGVNAAVALPRDRGRLTRLHLPTLLPDWSRLALSANQSEGSDDSLDCTADKIALPAAIDGGPLDSNIPKPSALFQFLDAAAEFSGNQKVQFIFRTGARATLNYRELREEAERLLNGLQAAGLKAGDKVIFQFDNNQDFICAFWACQLGGIVPAPIAVPGSFNTENSALTALRHAWDLLGHPTILSARTLAEDVESYFGPNNATVIDLQDLSAVERSSHRPNLGSEDPALMLFTSGSTGLPKAVMLSHANIAALSAALIQDGAITQNDVPLNWIPLDHVGSIVMSHIRDVLVGCDQVQIETEYVLANILRWLDLMSEFGATITWAPNFAYALINDQKAAIADGTWKLDQLRFIINGGEAVSASTALKFLEILAPHGLPATAIHPAWGMSETCSGVAFWHGLSPESISKDDKSVPVGRPIPGVAFKIVDDAGDICPEGVVGRLMASGPTITLGYFENREATAEAISEEGWLETGDLGVISNGDLTITGRRKNVIVINGVNYNGHEIETVLDQIDGIETSYSAAVAIPANDQHADRLAVFFVPKSWEQGLLEEIVHQILERVPRTVGVRPTFIVPVNRENIPKTSIGKIQHLQLRDAFLAGTFDAHLRHGDLISQNEQTLPNWFFERHWTRKILSHTPPAREVGTVLVFVREDGLSDAVKDTLGHQGYDVIEVSIGAQYLQHDSDRFYIDPNNDENLVDVLKAAEGNGQPVTHAIFLWNYREKRSSRTTALNITPDALNDSLYSFRSVCRAIARVTGRSDAFRLTAVSCEVERVLPQDEVDCTRSLILGYSRSAPHEISSLNCTHINVDDGDIAALAETIVDETLFGSEADVAIRSGNRYVPILSPIDSKKRIGARSSLFRKGRCYLLTGGLGGVGEVLAPYLLKNFEAQLILIGRSELDGDISDEILRKRALLGEWQKLPGKVKYLSADVTQPFALREGLAQTLSDWNCQLEGVFHLAGAYGEDSITEESNQSAMATIAPKVYGAIALSTVLDDYPDAFFVAFSSQTSLSGGPMVGAYAAANQFLDSLTQSWNRPNAERKAFSLCWTMLHDIGVSKQLAGRSALRSMGLMEISADQMIAALEIAVRLTPGQIVIGLDPTHPVTQRHMSVLPSSPSVMLYFEAPESGYNALGTIAVKDAFGTPCQIETKQTDAIPLGLAGKADRCAFEAQLRDEDSNFIPPRNEIEQRLAELWKSVLNMPQIGADSNFFELGGQSLLAMELLAAIEGEFGQQWSLRDIFENMTLARQAALLEIGGDKSQDADVVGASAPAAEQRLNLTSSQSRLWFLDRIGHGREMFNISAGIHFSAGCDPKTLESALERIIDRHDALRTAFPGTADGPVQIICPSLAANLTVTKIPPGETENASDWVRQWTVREEQTPFDMENGPLFRFRLLQVSDRDYHLIITIHHIISDGWSVRILLRDTLALYREQERGTTQSNLPKLPMSYADYVEQANNVLSSDRIHDQFLYWEKKLEGNRNGLELTTDFPRSPVESHRGARIVRHIPTAQSLAIRMAAQQNGCTLFVILVSAYMVLLKRLTRQNNVAVGTVSANRSQPEAQNLFGFLINLIVLRSELDDEITFSDCLRIVQNDILDAYKNSDIPFEELVERLQPDRDLSRSPFFQIAFDMHDREITETTEPDVKLSVMEVDNGTAQYDLHLTIKERGDDIVAIWTYATDLFTQETVEYLSESYERLICAAAQEPACNIMALPMLSDQARELVVDRWNTSHRDELIQAGTVLKEFDANCRIQPDAIAVAHGDETLSYRALDNWSNQIAHALEARGVGSGEFVALCLERSFEMIAAILGTLKTGAAYVPIDPAYPQDRIDFILDSCDARIVLSVEALGGSLGGDRSNLVFLDRNAKHIAAFSEAAPESVPEPSDLAYVIFTSGSTGKPKGVMIEHLGMLNMAKSQVEMLQIEPSSRVVQCAAFGFDASVWEIFGALVAGATVCFGDREDMLPGAGFARYLSDHRISVATMPPSILRSIPATDLPDLQTLVCAGEACAIDLVQQWGAGRKFINAYGPTETSVCASAGECNPKDDRVPGIGRSWPNTFLYVLDDNMQPVPPGVVGELYIGGVGVARGYLNRPDLTAERFIENPFTDVFGGRMYRSGDLVRRRADGNIEYVGRTDHQVKWRGFRIELGEIEAVICGHEAVQNAAVKLQMNGNADGALVAFADIGSAANTKTLADEIKEHANAFLPSFMLPTAFVLMDKMPLTPNGKIDRNGLEWSQPAPGYAKDEAVLPRSELEHGLAEIWSSVLEIDEVGIDRNFFDLGGHSLRMAQVQNRLEQLLQRDVSLVLLFQNPTVRTAAAALSANAVNGQAASKDNGAHRQRRSKLQERNRDASDRLASLMALRENSRSAKAD